MRTGYVVFTVAAVVFTALLAGCSGQDLLNDEQHAAPDVQACESPPLNAPAGCRPALPPVAALKQPSEGEVYHRFGAEYSHLLPHRNVSVTGDGLRFEPEAESNTPAYAILYLNTGAGETQQNINFRWAQTGDYGEAWLGMANRQRGAWEWLPFPAQDRFSHLFVDDEDDPSPYSHGGQVWFILLFYGDPWELELCWFDGHNACLIDSLSPFDIRGYTGDTLLLSATTTGPGPSDWHWDFAGGAEPNTSNDPEPAVTLGEPGVYSCRLTVDSDYGGGDSESFELTVYEAFPGWITAFCPYQKDNTYYSSPIAESIAQGSDGGICFAGSIEYQTGYMDLVRRGLIARYDANGDFEWARGWYYSYVSSSTPLVSVALDDAGNVYALGSYRGRPYLLSYDAQGDRRWSTLAWDCEHFTAGELCVTDGGGLYAAGAVAEGYDPGYALLAQYDTSGQLNWCRKWGNNADDLTIRALCCDASGNLYLGGECVAPEGGRNALLIKASEDGTVLWVKCWENGSLFALACQEDLLYAAGASNFAESHGEIHNSDVLVLCCGTDGDFQWARHWGDSDVDIAYGIAASADGTAIVTGYTNRTDLDPWTPHRDVLLLTFSQEGELLSERSSSGSRMSGRDILLGADGGLVIGGETNDGPYMNWRDLDIEATEESKAEYSILGETTTVPLDDFYYVGFELRLEAKPPGSARYAALLLEYDHGE